jgi:predicted PurR-regulated permease PerM
MRNPDFSNVLGRRIALGLFLTGLMVLSYRVLELFLVPVAWAIVLVSVTWPAYGPLRRLMGRYVGLSALVMTLLLGLTFALPLLWVIYLLRVEVPTAYASAIEILGQGPEILPPSVAHLPGIGPELERLLSLFSEDPAALRAQMVQWMKPWVDQSLAFLGDIGITAFKFTFALLTAFFFYRDGERLLDQSGRLLRGLLGDRSRDYLNAVDATIRAVLYGLVLTAVAQGALAGVGYWAAGVRAPAMLGVMTAIFALVPFGTPLVWGAVCLWLLASGETLAAAGLAAWGGLVVSQIDNLVRPLVISSATRIPYILVLFGVLGGIAAFGLVGLFLGPIVIAVLLAVWREWIEEQGPPTERLPAPEPMQGQGPSPQPEPAPLGASGQQSDAGQDEAIGPGMPGEGRDP